MASGRCLWPCSDSHFLRLPHYQQPSLHACLLQPASPDDILVSDSDDDLDTLQRSAKRRKIEAIAHSFLRGQPIFIPSAHLRGPFPRHRDLSSCHDLFESPAVQSSHCSSVVASESFIRRRDSRPAREPTATPEPLPTPSRPPQSSPPPTTKSGKLKRLSRPQSRSVRRRTLRFDLPPDTSATTTYTPHQNHVQSPRKSTPLHGLLSPPETRSHAPSSGQTKSVDPPISDNTPIPPPSPAPLLRLPSSAPSISRLSPLNTSSRDASGVLKQRPTSHLNKTGSAPSASPKPLSAVKKQSTINKKKADKRYQAVAGLDAASPFMYRKNALQSKSIHPSDLAKELKGKQHDADEDTVIDHQMDLGVEVAPNLPQSRRLVLFESSLEVPEPAPAQRLPSIDSAESREQSMLEEIPAINMSFGQESLDMGFDFLKQYKAAPQSSSGGQDHVRNDPNTKSTKPGVTTVSGSEISGDILQPFTKPGLTPVVNGWAVVNKTSGAVHGQENAALDDACSPLAKPELHEAIAATEVVTDQSPDESTAMDLIEQTSVDNHSAGHNEMDDIYSEPGDEAPYISTQAAMQDAHRALFDASSPVKVQNDTVNLPLETPAREQTNVPSSPVHTITPFHKFNAEMATDTQAPLPSTQALFDAFSPIKLSTKKPRAVKRASFAPSIIAENTDSGKDTMLETSTFLEEKQAMSAPDLSGSAQPSSKSPSSAETAKSRSSSPDFIASQKSPRRTSETKGPVLEQQRFRLSDILEAVSSQRDVDVSSLFSQDSSRPSSAKAPKQKKKRKSRASGERKFELKPGSKPRAGQRKSTRVAMSQPDRQSEVEPELDPSTAHVLPLSNPGSGQPLTRPSLSGSSTIPDPSIALSFLQQNATPASGRHVPSPGSRLQSTARSSYQPAQNLMAGLEDVDSTIEDFQQSFLQPWDVESAMRTSIDASTI